MGKKHSGMKKGFKEINIEDAPSHIKEMMGGKEKTDVKNISGEQRDFVQMQRDYNSVSWGVVVLSAELEAMMEQIQLPVESRSIKWNGMIMPDKVLKAHTGLKNLKYIEGIHQKESIKKNLLNQGLTEEQIRIAGEDGHYVTTLPKNEMNIGEEAEHVKKG